MGTSVLLVFLAPFMAVYFLFAGIFSEIMPQPQAELVLPYDESQGLVWEYVEQEDYNINLLEVKVEGDEQIFVFEADQAMSNMFKDIFGGTTGEVIDLVFKDQNGNTKTYYHDPEKENSNELVIYEESECLVTEYTVTAKEPAMVFYWSIDHDDQKHILRHPSGGDETTHTIVFMPDDIEKLASGESSVGEINFTNLYFTLGVEDYYVTFGVENDQLVILDERYEFN